MVDEKMSADDYFNQYGINPDVERSNLTDEMASQILKKAAEALNSQSDKLAIIESIKDGAFEVLQVLKTAGTIAAILT